MHLKWRQQENFRSTGLNASIYPEGGWLHIKFLAMRY